MRHQLARPLCGLICLLISFGAPATSYAESDAAVTSKIIDNVRVSEPVTFKNLSVYFLHSDQRDDRRFLTLNEGLEKELVKVTERKNEEVGRLTIENLSGDPLFLQEGDRVTGGKQDRTIYTSLIIPPKSGFQEIPTFCVERSRWQQGKSGLAFMCNRNPGYAANSVRQASKLLKSQGIVWQNVAIAKQQLMKSVGNSDKTSSLNEAQDSNNVTESTRPYVNALAKAATEHKDLVGFAFAVNGKIQEINLYPGNTLAQTVYPRLLETYTLDAIVATHSDEAPNPAKDSAPSSESVLKLIRAELESKPVREEKINEENALTILAAKAGDEENKTRLYRCLTEYQGRPVHLQWIQGPASIEQASRQAVQQGAAQQMQLNINNFNFNRIQQVPQTNQQDREPPQ